MSSIPSLDPAPDLAGINPNVAHEVVARHSLVLAYYLMNHAGIPASEWSTHAFTTEIRDICECVEDVEFVMDLTVWNKGFYPSFVRFDADGLPTRGQDASCDGCAYFHPLHSQPNCGSKRLCGEDEEQREKDQGEEERNQASATRKHKDKNDDSRTMIQAKGVGDNKNMGNDERNNQGDVDKQDKESSAVQQAPTPQEMQDALFALFPLAVKKPGYKLVINQTPRHALERYAKEHFWMAFGNPDSM